MKRLSAILVLLLFNSIIKAESLDVADILDRYESNQRQISQFIVSETAGIKSIGKKGTSYSYKESTFAYDGNRINHQYRRWPKLTSITEEKKPEKTESRALLWDNKAQYEYRKEVDNPGKLFISMVNDMTHSMVSLGYTGAPLMGLYLGDHENIGSILRKAKSINLRPEKENVNESLCYVIDAKTENGSYTVWIDPGHGYNISRVAMKKRQGDLAWGKPLGWVSNHYSPNMPKVDPYKEISFTLDNVCFEEIDSIWIPVEATYENIFVRSESTSSSNVNVKRQSVKLNPDFKALRAFKPGIPDGTYVWIIEVPGISYEWKDGKVVDAQGREVDLDALKPKEQVSLAGKQMPSLEQVGAKVNPADVEDKRILVCFFDVNQRPSRHMVSELAKRAENLKAKGVVVVCIQASKVERGKLDEWVKENEIPFNVGMIEGDEEKVRFNWGVKSLPWLILADAKQIIRAEGFGIEELDEKIKENENVED